MDKMTNEQLMIKALHEITQCSAAQDARDIAHEVLTKIKGQSARWTDNGYYMTDTGKKSSTLNKYQREIKKGVFVDVYDVLKAWRVVNPALQDLIKKALQPGARGHKSYEQDMKDIIDSAVRAAELDGVK